MMVSTNEIYQNFIHHQDNSNDLHTSLSLLSCASQWKSYFKFEYGKPFSQ